MEKAYSLMNVKDVREDARGLTIKGIASTPSPDHAEDIVEPMGAQFKMPMPLLWGHDAAQAAIGRVEFAQPTRTGIPFEAFLPYVKEPGRLKDRIDEAIHAVKYRLVTGVSIGFKGLEREPIKNGGWRYKRWNWLELSLVNIPANAEATITTVKSISSASRPDLSVTPVVRLSPPAVAETKAHSSRTPMNLNDSLSAAEKRRDDLAVAHKAALDDVLQKGTTLDDDTQVEQTKQLEQIEKLDEYIDFLKRSEATLSKAKPIIANRPSDDVRTNVGYITVKQNKEPGIAFAQALRCLYKANGVDFIAAQVAKQMYRDDPSIETVFKATGVDGGGTVAGNWGADFTTTDGGPFQEFLEFLRPKTIIGRIPGVTNVDFYKPIGVQTGGGAGYWVGEGKGKGLTSFTATPLSIPPTKVANIVAVTEEWLRFPSNNNDRRIRDSMAGALIERMDVDFVDPNKSISAGISPASITNGAANQAAGGTGDYGDIIADLKYMMGVLSANNSLMASPVLIVDNVTAMGLSLATNAMGARVFPNVNLNGGTFEFGIPVVVSNSVPHATAGGTAILINAKEILIADEGGFDITMSRDASLEMNDDPSQDSLDNSSGVSMVSMFQTDSVAFRAHRYVGWLRAKTESVVYVTSVKWGAA